MKHSLFVSDLHLAEERPRISAIFFEFVRNVAAQAEALYILGDLFEYWIGDDGLDEPLNAVVADALGELGARGVAVHFLHGNRDFLIGRAFAMRARATLISDPTMVDLYGTRTLLMHGDTLCTDDVAYQDFRRMVRNPQWQQAFLTRPLAERKAQIEQLRLQSEQQKQQKPMAIMDVNKDAVIDAFRRHDVSTMIHGHTHRLASHHYEIDGKKCVRHVLGDWQEHMHGGNYLACSPDGWQRGMWWPEAE